MNYYLREISRSDISEINKWRNDKELIFLLGATFRYIDLEIDNAWFDNYLKNRNNTVRCSIVNEKNFIIGLITLSDIDYVNRKAVLHIMIGNKTYQNKGVGTFAINEMLNHAFSNLNLNRVELQVLENNQRAVHVYSKIGFVKEGILRNYCYKNGKYHNLIVMSVLKDEYKTGE